MPPPRSDTYERIGAFMAERMRMSPIDQPLMLMELLGRRSPAPAQDVARRILGEDVTQIDYTTERVKRMVGRVHLQRHHPLRARHLRPGGRGGAERRRARPGFQRGSSAIRIPGPSPRKTSRQRRLPCRRRNACPKPMTLKPEFTIT